MNPFEYTFVVTTTFYLVFAFCFENSYVCDECIALKNADEKTTLKILFSFLLRNHPHVPHQQMKRRFFSSLVAQTAIGKP